MPIYEYLCDDCGNHYERIVMNQKTEIACPKCESTKQTLQLSIFVAPASGGAKPSGGGSPASSGGGCCGGSCGCN